mmetsp:Transcript_9393/g.12348  ORF Transcript_9393/g.12348 Transcript_9393/m.12348 type:complete len:463 (-) Transcript_9393:239-1627(-)
MSKDNSKRLKMEVEATPNGQAEPMKVSEGESEQTDLEILLSRPTPFGSETSKKLALGEFDPEEELSAYLKDDCKVLVIGAGGLGCEILKDLALSGFGDIHVIDLDTIDVSNLNRQFLFRQKDVGQPKATVAAEFINSRIPGVHVTAYHGKIQDYDEDFYAQFNVVISGLDNIEARRWLNSMLVSLVEVDENNEITDPSTVVPFIDGGTEGFKGQARVILPRLTSCFECSLDAFPPQKNFPLCTIAETPRRPEHCIAYAYILQWEKAFPNKKLDADDPEHMSWVYHRALERAEQYGIEGVTYTLTMGVVKNIIPAVASTNAIVAAACCNEAVKILTYCGQTMNNYLMYMGSTGIHTHTFEYERKEDCPVCSASERKLTVSPDLLLKDLIQQLTEDSDLRLTKPSMTTTTQTLYMQNPPALEAATKPNLEKALKELINHGDVVTITDPVYPQGMGLSVSLQFSN